MVVERDKQDSIHDEYYISVFSDYCASAYFAILDHNFAYMFLNKTFMSRWEEIHHVLNIYIYIYPFKKCLFSILLPSTNLWHFFSLQHDVRLNLLQRRITLNFPLNKSRFFCLRIVFTESVISKYESQLSPSFRWPILFLKIHE